MKNILYAIGALALATTTAHAADDGFRMQSERHAVMRGDDVRSDRAPADHRFGSATKVQLQREVERPGSRGTFTAAPKSDAWMTLSDDRDTVYGN